MNRSPLSPVSARRQAEREAAGIRVNSTFMPRQRATNDQPRRSTLTSRPQPAVPRPVVRALAARSGGVCEAMLPVCLRAATDPCHRVKRGMGGRHGGAAVESARLSDLWHGCRACHGWTHDNPARSYEMGLMVHEGFDPAVEPVLYRGRWVLLGDDGSVHDLTGRAA